MNVLRQAPESATGTPTATNVEPQKSTVEPKAPETNVEPQGPKDTKTEPEKAPESKLETKETKSEPLTLKDISIPEGFKADEKQLGAALEIYNNPDIPTKDKFQTLVSMYADGMKQLADHNQKLWTDTQVEWTKNVANDPEVGSGDIKSPLKAEAKETISKVIDQLGGKELRDVLALTGAGNHPAFAKAFFKMGQYMTEGKFVAGNPPSNSRPGIGSQAMYPGLPAG